MAVFRGGERVDTLRPEKRFYKKPEQPASEVAIRSTLGADLYLVLGSYDDKSGVLTLLAYLNPLVGFMWWGGLVLALGTAIGIWPARVAERQAASAAAPAQPVPE
jgi:cytochrome c-type biogenesis protein CcmF